MKTHFTGIKVLVAAGLTAYDDSYSDVKNRRLQSEVLYVFLRNRKVSSVVSGLAERCPAEGNKVFGGACNGRYIVGVGKKVYEFVEQQGKWKPKVISSGFEFKCKICDKEVH